MRLALSYPCSFLVTLVAAGSLVGAVDSFSLAPPRNGNVGSRRLPTKSTASTLSTEEGSRTEPSYLTDSGTRILADADEFIQPERDLRQYRRIRLANNLECLLVSDQLHEGQVGVEAASVHVQAGHMDDTLPGLAHFHEHLLFLGTSKYPFEEEYESFLQQAGGFSNAYTDMEDTNYFFSITTEVNDGNTTTPQLRGALDHLAQFFVSPLFKTDSVERELRAIDSEYRNSKTSDAWRNYQLLKASVDQRHPFSKFGCGNYETLTSQGVDTLLEELHRFWETYYKSYNLRLAVVGHGSLDGLQQTVEETFGALPPSEGTPRRSREIPGQFFVRENAVYGVPALTDQQLGVEREVIPVQETRTIKLYFAMPPFDDPKLRSSKVYRSISHVLGHEAPGSLHALLNQEGYLTGLSSGAALDVSDFSLFSLTLSLTPKGMANRQHVLDLAFQWIALVKENQDKLVDYHAELQQIATMNFLFRENGDPTDFCSSAAELMFEEDTPPERILVAPSESTELDPETTRAFLDRLRPDNCMITILDSDLDDSVGEWRTEPWYGARYRVQELTTEQKQKWEFPDIDKRLQLPALNAYIPSDFSLVCDKRGTEIDVVTSDEIKKPPNLLVDRPNLRLWHKMDRSWRVPKTFIRLALLSPNVYRSPRSMTLNRIFQRVLNDDLNSFVYDASIAGCGYGVSCAPSGYRISVRGYSEKLPILLDTLTTHILSLIDEMKQGDPVLRDRFAKAKESLLRETKNYRLDAPHEIANYNSRLLIEEKVWYLDNYIAEMEGEEADKDPLTMEECAHVAQECLMGRLQCEALCMGNIDEQGAREVSKVIDRHFLEKSRPLSEAEMPSIWSVKLPTRDEAIQIFGPGVADKTVPLVYQELAFSESEENNAVELILQAGCELDLGYEGVAILDLITHMAYNSAFGQLRTKEQLGYIVSAFARKTAGGAWGMSILIQSSVALPEVLEERIEAWLAQYRKELEETSAEDIALEANAVVSQLLEGETKLSQEVSRSWGEILNTEGFTDRMRTPAFDRLERIAEALAVSDEEGKSGGFKTAQELKERVLSFFDEHFVISSPKRRAMSARVYNQKSKAHYETSLNTLGVLSTFPDLRHFKQFLSTWPIAPYWRLSQ